MKDRDYLEAVISAQHAATRYELSGSNMFKGKILVNMFSYILHSMAYMHSSKVNIFTNIEETLREEISATLMFLVMLFQRDISHMCLIL